MEHAMRRGLRINLKSDIIYIWLIAIALGDGYIIRVLANRIASFIPGGLITGPILMYGLFAILYLLKFQEILNNLIKKKTWDVAVIVIFVAVNVIVFKISGWDTRIHTETETMARLVFFSLPVYAMARSISDYDYIAERLWIVGYVFFFASLSFLASSTNNIVGIQQGYDNFMSLGYQFGLCALIFLENYYHTENKKPINYVNLAMGILCLVLIIAYGSRGTLLVCAVYIVHLMLETGRKNGFSQRTFLLIAVVIVAFLMRNMILEALLSLIGNAGINSRTIAWLLRQDVNITSSGRDQIYSTAWSYIMMKPMLGTGLLGDRVYYGQYVHNLFLELMISHGIIFGGIFSIIIIINYFRAMLDYNTIRINYLVVFAIIQLVVSSSYIQSGCFWIALGIMLSARKILNYQEVET